MATKTQLIGSCFFHGEFYMDAPDSPCPSCEDSDINTQVSEYVEKDGVACPFCGSTALGSSSGLEIRGNAVTNPIHCTNCGRHWLDIYTLNGIVYDDEWIFADNPA